MSRKKGRVLAFQALYAYDLGGKSLEELLSLTWHVSEEGEEDDPAPLPQDTQDFARILIAGTINHLAEIDAAIERHLKEDRTIADMHRVSLAILRISVYSLLFQKEIDASIIIDEGITIAKNYGEGNSFKFINALLDNVNKELRT